MRKLPLALACALIIGSSNALAIGLGELQTQSYLNQPLRAMIPLIDVRPSDLDALSVKMADEAHFARYGYSLLSVYGRIKMQIVGGQRPHILLTSDAPVRDPALGLVIDVNGPSGNLERAVSILLDPEGYRPVAIAMPSKPAVASRPMADYETKPARVSAVPAPVQHSTVQVSAMPEGGDYGPVAEGTTLWSIAQSVRSSGVSTQQAMAAILQANPKAFANPTDVSTLRAGAYLKIPDAQTMRQVQPTVKPAAKPAKNSNATKTAAPVADAAPRLNIVQPTTQAATPAGATPNVVVAPVVGEVVSAGMDAAAPTANQASNQPAAVSAEMLEQFEANKLENERLTGLLASQDERLQKMEELLRINETLIKEMEQKLNAAPVAPAAIVSAPVDAAPAMPWWSPWLMGLGALVAMVLAYLFGARRRRDEEPQAGLVHVKTVQDELVSLRKPQASEPVSVETEVLVPASTVVAAPVVAAIAETSMLETAMSDPVQTALEEADVMQAYGLHDRALQVLSDALQAQPGDPILMARHARAQHEAGDGEAFVREAQAFREKNPEDEIHWAELSALGAANYPDSPLFKDGHEFGAADEITSEVSSGIADTSFWAAPENNDSQESDDDSALIQPLESLDLGVPQSALSELLATQGTPDSQIAPVDMQPLELDFPEVTLPGRKTPEKSSERLAAHDASSSQPVSFDMPEVTLSGGAMPEKQSDSVADFAEDWAPLELPMVGDATHFVGMVSDAPGMHGTSADESLQELSADDLAMLGIDADELGVDWSEDIESAAQDVAVESEFTGDQTDNMSSLNDSTDALALFLSNTPDKSADVEPIEPLDFISSSNESEILQPIDKSYLSFETVGESEIETKSEAGSEVFVAPESALEWEVETDHAVEHLSLDWPATPVMEPLTLSESAPTPAPAPVEANGMVSEEEVKLDIALAFMDLGDIAGAREMLDEVLASECSLELKSRATQLIETLST
jgi:pilus assembly protein FimV